jgi:hypothetical protein
MANATRNVRAIFEAAQCPLTLTDIKLAMPELKSNQISMSLCYFMRKGDVTRTQVPNEQSKGRKNVWLYTYTPQTTKETT